jgi:hypothetical protein
MPRFNPDLLPASAFIDPTNFTTSYDLIKPKRNKEQYEAGLAIGRASHTIYINRHSSWASFALRNASHQLATFSHERIGTHANTSELLRGFLDSPAAILVRRETEGLHRYTLIKQSAHPEALECVGWLACFDFDVWEPVWRETTEQQFNYYRSEREPRAIRADAFLSALLTDPYSDYPTSLALKKAKGRFYAKLMTLSDFINEFPI